MKTVDIMDILPEEAYAAVDADGYALLAMLGYRVKGAEKFEKRRKKLKLAMKRRGHSLRHRAIINDETGELFIFFELWGNGKIIGRSNGVRLRQVEEGKKDDRHP